MSVFSPVAAQADFFKETQKMLSETNSGIISQAVTVSAVAAFFTAMLRGMASPDTSTWQVSAATVCCWSLLAFVVAPSFEKLFRQRRFTLEAQEAAFNVTKVMESKGIAMTAENHPFHLPRSAPMDIGATVEKLLKTSPSAQAARKTARAARKAAKHAPKP